MTHGAWRTLYFLFGAFVGAFSGTAAMEAADGWKAVAGAVAGVFGMMLAARPWIDPEKRI